MMAEPVNSLELYMYVHYAMIQLRSGQCQACICPIWDAQGYSGEHEGCVIDARCACILNTE